MVLSIWGDSAQQYEPPGLWWQLGFLILGHSKIPFEREKSSKPKKFCRFWNQRVPNGPTQLFPKFQKVKLGGGKFSKIKNSNFFQNSYYCYY